MTLATRLPINVLPARPSGPIRVAVSDCLVGNPVRYDGGHKRSSLCHAELDGLLELVPVCPEVGIGLSVPRPPMHLVRVGGNVIAREIDNPSQDHTDALTQYAHHTVARLPDVCGHILMKNSPSCGLMRVKVYPDGPGAPERSGKGVFAAQLARLRPELPMEEAGRMNDPVLRDNFLTRVYTLAHWRAVEALGMTPARLVAFHSVHKFQLMAHSDTAARRMGRLVAGAGSDVGAATREYLMALMSTLSTPATRGGHSNVLQHLQGYLPNDLPANVRSDVSDAIHGYRRGELPLLAPITLLNHHLRSADVTYALAQTYLQPYPTDNSLRRNL